MESKVLLEKPVTLDVELLHGEETEAEKARPGLAMLTDGSQFTPPSLGRLNAGMVKQKILGRSTNEKAEEWAKLAVEKPDVHGVCVWVGGGGGRGGIPTGVAGA